LFVQYFSWHLLTLKDEERSTNLPAQNAEEAVELSMLKSRHRLKLLQLLKHHHFCRLEKRLNKPKIK